MADTERPETSQAVAYWLEQIEGAQKWHQEWHDKGKKVVEIYIDKKAADEVGITSRRMNVLWSNVQTTMPALYAKMPSPKVQRRFRDKDPVGRWAAIVIERANAFELDAYDDDTSFRAAIQDYLLPGRGQVWVNYEPRFQTMGEVKALTWECCKVRHLHWRDFITSPARSWVEVWWVAKREYLSKDEAVSAGLNVEDLTFSDKYEDESPASGARVKKAAIWEIWNKADGKVYFVSRSCPVLLKEPTVPGFTLENFFPCPRPLTATTSTDTIIPQPDYCLYQDQAEEINRLTNRIGLLTKALRVAGVYNASQPALGKLLEDGNENVMIPCDTFAVLAANGGIKGAIDFFPLDQIIQALKQCYDSRERAKATMYEITGISDIVRGASDPSETATAQQIKSQWGGLRIRDRQKDVQRFVRDVMRIKSEIYAEVFQPETLKQMSNVPLATEQEKAQLKQRQAFAVRATQLAQANPQVAQAIVARNPQILDMVKPLTMDEQERLREPSWEQVMGLLRDQKLRGFHIDIETDSTIQADETAEKMARTEFLTAMTGFINSWGPIVKAQPKLAGLAGQMLLFGARAFKGAEQLESTIEEAVDAMTQQANAPPPMPVQPPPQQPQMAPPAPQGAPFPLPMPRQQFVPPQAVAPPLQAAAPPPGVMQ